MDAMGQLVRVMEPNTAGGVDCVAVVEDRRRFAAFQQIQADVAFSDQQLSASWRGKHHIRFTAARMRDTATGMALSTWLGHAVSAVGSTPIKP